MTKQEQENINRRTFLKAAAATAVVATATGAGAALLKNQPPSPVSPPAALPPAAPAVQNAVVTNQDNAALLARLAEAQAENVRLQAALDAAQRNLEALQQSYSGTSPATEQLSVELGAANERISVLSGLVALYEQLDEVDIVTTVDEGMGAVSDTISGLIEGVPSLSEGLDLGQQALMEFEAHIPLLENGRIWLENQLAQIQNYYESIESLVQAAVKTVGPLLEMISEWVEDILKWLPFGLGQRTGQIMVAITDLLAETPNTISGMATNIAQPLDVWLVREEDEAPALHRNLIKPLREQVIEKANETITQAQEVQTVYQTQLSEPAQTAIENQQRIRELITAYRQQNQI